jgi:hypothetical protein
MSYDFPSPAPKSEEFVESLGTPLQDLLCAAAPRKPAVPPLEPKLKIEDVQLLLKLLR